MAAPVGNFVGLNLGPRYTGPSSHVPLNLGVEWAVPDPPDPPEPVIRGIRRALTLPWLKGVTHARRMLRPTWGIAPALRREWSMPWQKPTRCARAIALAWGTAPAVKREAGFAWRGRMARAQRGTTLPWRTPPRAQRGVSMPWRQMPGLRGRAPVIAWRGDPALQQRGTSIGWRGRLARALRDVGLGWHNPGQTRVLRWIPWGVARRVPWLVLPPRPPRPPEPPSWIPDGRFVGLNLGCPVMQPGFVPLNLGMDACYLVRRHRRTYVVHNTVLVERLPDELPIEVLDIGLSGGADAFGWTLDMTLADASQLSLLQPNEDGPRPVRVTLNGYVWTFIVESYARNREFGGRSVRVSGRSRTALLAAPYAPARTKISTEERSAAQLVDEELAGTGYVADYDTVDWLVPPGAWFYESTPPMDAIARVAAASGGVVQSHPADLELQVRARYPVSPWDWTDSTPDHVIPDDLVTVEALQVRSAPLYNAVVVTGELAGKGVTAKVTRSGEGGDLYAPQASDPLINTDGVATERGRNVLSDRGEQAAIDITVPLFPAPVAPGLVGRVLPLDLVQAQQADGTWHGLCTGVRLDVRVESDAVVIEQTLTLERHFSDAD